MDLERAMMLLARSCGGILRCTTMVPAKRRENFACSIGIVKIVQIGFTIHIGYKKQERKNSITARMYCAGKIV